MSDVIPIKGPNPHEHRIIDTLSFTGEDEEVFILALTPPVEMRGMDLKRNGSILSIGRLAACHIMGDMAGATMSELPHQERLEYAREMEVEVNSVFDSGLLERDVDDPVVYAALVYEALLRVGILAVPEDPEQFIKQ